MLGLQSHAYRGEALGGNINLLIYPSLPESVFSGISASELRWGGLGSSNRPPLRKPCHRIRFRITGLLNDIRQWCIAHSAHGAPRKALTIVHDNTATNYHAVGALARA